MTREKITEEGADDDEKLDRRQRPGRSKDVASAEKAERNARVLPPVDHGMLVLRSSRGHAWLESKEGEGEKSELHALLPRWAQVVPGDFVQVDKQGRVIGAVPRRNALRRQVGVKGERVLAANLDQVMIVVGPGLLLREGFLARALCGVLACGIDPILVFQKVDLDEDGVMTGRSEIYRKAGFPVHRTSANRGEGIDALRARLVNKATVLLGQSGVGKSSLVNAMFPEVNLKVGEVDGWGRGKHTTTLGRAIRAGGGILIDSPGVREFGLTDLDPLVLGAAFPDIAKLAAKCKYNDCPHLDTEGCAVEPAVDKGKLDPDRWAAYVAVVSSFEAGDEGGGRG